MSVTAMTIATIVIGTPVAVAGALAAGAAAASVDLRTRRLPNRMVALTAGMAGIGVVVASLEDAPASAIGAGLGALGFAGPLLVTHLVTPGAIGFGDVKLAGALGIALGLVDPRLGLLALCIASGTTAAAGIAARRNALPLGPGLVVGSLLAVALAEVVVP